MEEYFKSAILNSGISLSCVVSLFNVIDNANYNEFHSMNMSDTPSLNGRLDEDGATAITHFALNNLG